MLHKRSLVVPLLVLALGCQGCATVGWRTRTEDTVLATRRRSSVVGVGARYEQDGTRLQLVATQTCATREVRDVQRTVTKERYNETPGKDWAWGISGALVAGGGAALIATRNLFPAPGSPAAQCTQVANQQTQSGTSTQQCPFTSTTAVALGVGLAVVGASFLTVAIVDGARTSGGAVEVTKVEVEGDVQPEEPCPGRPPAAHEKIFAGTVLLGETDDQGKLDLDLAQTSVPGGPKTLPLVMRGRDFGRVDLTSVVAQREEVTWRALDLKACVDILFVPCDPLKSFLLTFPNGAHADEVRGVLRRAEDEHERAVAGGILARDEALGRMERARRAAQQAAQARAACKQKCSAVCGGNAVCVNSCTASKCR